MSGSRALPASPCPNCTKPTVEIWFTGNHGEEWLLEQQGNRNNKIDNHQ